MEAVTTIFKVNTVCFDRSAYLKEENFLKKEDDTIAR